jgi:hypothetical protein
MSPISIPADGVGFGLDSISYILVGRRNLQATAIDFVPNDCEDEYPHAPPRNICRKIAKDNIENKCVDGSRDNARHSRRKAQDDTGYKSKE